ncbi:MAG: SRPBCC domain-containing protein [Acidimicrobiia bacterium]
MKPNEELPRVERSVDLGIGPEQLWQYLVTGELASLWMGGVMTIEPRLNGKVLLHAEKAPPVFGTVEAITNGEELVWTWRTAEGEPTQVSIRITEQPGGSALTVSEQMVPYEIVHVPIRFG